MLRYVVWEDSTYFPGTSYLIDYFDIARFEGEQNKLFRFLKKRSVKKLFCCFYLDELIYF